MDHAKAQALAKQWVRDWNAHDIDALLEHFTDDVVFTSPVAIRIFGGDGVLRGKEALRKYWSEGVRAIPDLHFEVLALYVGVSTLVINYRNLARRSGQRGSHLRRPLGQGRPWDVPRRTPVGLE